MAAHLRAGPTGFSIPRFFLFSRLLLLPFSSVSRTTNAAPDPENNTRVDKQRRRSSSAAPPPFVCPLVPVGPVQSTKEREREGTVATASRGRGREPMDPSPSGGGAPSGGDGGNDQMCVPRGERVPVVSYLFVRLLLLTCAVLSGMCFCGFSVGRGSRGGRGSGGAVWSALQA